VSPVDRRTFLLGSAGLVLLTACGEADSAGSGKRTDPLSISAIPDQDPELLNRLYPKVAERFAEATGEKVEYRPVSD
jgi:phosphonate transport system substrate-binding protein